MIAGETEQLLEDHLEDDFFRSKEERLKRRAMRKARRAERKAKRVSKRVGRKANRVSRREMRKSEPRRIARRTRRGNFGSRLGQVYHQIGGAATIGSAVDTLFSKPIPQAYDTNVSSIGMAKEAPKDYSFGLNARDETATNEENVTKDKKKNYTPFIIGGVAAVGLLGLGILMYKSNQKNYIHVTK